MKDAIKVKIDETEAEAKKRTFSTGKEGYGYYDKIEIDGDRYQVSLNVIKLQKK